MKRPPADALRGARVLVTGADGFLGASLVRRLLADGLAVEGLVRRMDGLKRLGPLAQHPNLTLLQGDLHTDAAHLAPRLQYDVIFHAAAILPGAHADAAALHAVNVEAPLLLAQAMARCGGRLLQAGTMSVYASSADPITENAPLAPVGEYARSKAAASSALAALGTDAWCELRLFGVYGPMEAPARLLPYLARQLDRGEPAHLTHGRQLRDFVFVDDVLDAFLLAAVAPAAGGMVCNIGSGQGREVREVAQLAGELLGRPELLRFGQAPNLSAAPDRCVADIARARALLGWEPATDIREGVRQTLRWALEDSARG